MSETSSTTSPEPSTSPATSPPPTPVAVTVTAPTVPTPVVDGYTQFVLTVIALLLGAIAVILVIQFAQNFRSLQDVLLLSPNATFDETPLPPAVKNELQKQTSSERFMPLGRVFLSATAMGGKNGQNFIWRTARANRWKDAGFVIFKDQEEVAKSASLSQADQKRLLDAGVETVATVEPTEKGKQYACDAERRKAFGWACLEVSLGDFDQLRIVRTELGKKGLFYYRLTLGTFEVDPSPEMQALYSDQHFWGYECAVVLRHDPFRDTWKIVGFRADQINETDLDTTEIMKLWSTMER